MSDAEVGAFVRFVLVAAALVFTIFRIARDRREHQRVESLFADNASKYGRRRDDAEFVDE